MVKKKGQKMINHYHYLLALCCCTISIITNNAIASEHYLKKQFKNNNRKLTTLDNKFSRLKNQEIPHATPDKTTIPLQAIKALQRNNLQKQDEIGYHNASLVNKMMNKNIDL